MFDIAFLEYLYLDKIRLNEELAMGLFALSERYVFDKLKKDCERYLIKSLGLDNCSKIFEAAYFYEDPSLMKKTLTFFQANLKRILQRKDFEDLPRLTYIYIKKIQWNEKIILDPSFAEFMNNQASLAMYQVDWRKK